MKINLYWYKHAEGYGNFGDEASPYIIEKLSGKKVRYFNFNLISNDSLLNLKLLVKNLFLKNITIIEFLKYFSFRFFGIGKVILSIGSILSYKEDRRAIVWGSGIMRKSTNFGNADFVAVRGYRTIDKLKELNYNAPDVVGDPALLLPLLYSSSNSKKYKLGIIPHHIHYDELKKLDNNNVKVINLLHSVEDVINEINSCEVTISTSLHGIIVSHAYKVPSLWVDFRNEKKLVGDDIKFEDYFSSVEISAYKAFKLDPSTFNLENVLHLFKNQNQYLATDRIILKIQSDLISVAPFSVKEKYINKVRE